MNKVITKKQELRLENDMAVKRLGMLNGEYEFTADDVIIDVFLPVKRGIRKHGLTVPELMDIIGLNKNNHKELCLFRTSICNFAQKIVKEGYPFGGLKDGVLKKYGWAHGEEFDEIGWVRKKRLASEITNSIEYLEDGDAVKSIGKRLLGEIDKQMILFQSECA